MEGSSFTSFQSSILKNLTSDSTLKRVIKKAMLTNFNARYTDQPIMELLNKTHFLDPQFKSMLFSDEAKKMVIEGVQEEEL